MSISKPWTAVVRLNERDLDFKIDTGADVTVIPESAHQPEKDGELEPASIPLNGPTGENLEVYSRFKASLSRKGEESWQMIYVVRNLSRPLLGRPEIQALKSSSTDRASPRRQHCGGVSRAIQWPGKAER